MKYATSALCAALMLSGSLVGAQGKGPASDPQVMVGAETFQLERSDVSPALRDMAPIPPSWWEQERGGYEVHRWPIKPRKLRLQRDPVLQVTDSRAARVATTAGRNFDGIGSGNYSISGAPPDTVGAAGTTQYVQWVNTAFAVYDKSTGNKLYGPANGSTLWQGFGGRCETDNSGDPIVMFDRIANRWVMTQFAVSASPYYQCVAVSTTADATGTYRRFAYSFGTDMNDYPKGGVWPDAYYITYNMFANASTWKGAKVCAYDRNNMISASGTPGAMQCFQLSTSYGGLLPADLDGSTLPPSGAPNYHLAFDDTNRNGLNLWKFHVDWATPANSTFTGPTKITGAAFDEFYCSNDTSMTCVPQPGTTQKLDTLADRLMYRLAYRNMGTHEVLVVNHSVDKGSGIGGVRWYEVRNPNGTPSVHQQGTFSPDSHHRWMGSIAMDQQGNIAVGYSVSSSSVYPSVRYTGRLATDTLGTMQAETELVAGSGSQGTSLNRWGDYSAMTIDPVDDCTFWYTTEYIKTTGTYNWSTRIGSFKFPSCGGTVTPDFSLSTSPSSVSVNPGSSVTSTVTVSSLNGFNSAVALSASGLPSGVTASFSPSSVTPASGGSATSTLTLTASSSAAAGTTGVTVSGVNGSTTRTASVSLTVNAQGQAVYDSTLKAPKCATVGKVCDSGASLVLGRATLGPEPNYPNTINSSCADGTSGTYHSDESLDALKVETTDGTSFAGGKQVKVTATVYAYSTSQDYLDLYYTANASSPSWTLVGTYSPTATGLTTITANYTLPTGTLQAVRANFRYQGSAGSCTTGSYDDRDDLVFAVGTASDTTPPTTSITAPAAGATVSGTSSVTASASDNVGVTTVEFYLDGALKSTDTTSPYAWSWDTTTATNGSHSLQSKAYDAAGNVGTSTAVSVTVNNAVADTTPPSTAITAPSAGSTLSGTYSVTASASDNVGVTKVEFHLDGSLQSSDTTSPYAWSWDTTTATNASHSLQSKAYDAAGNVGTSTAVSVTVSNAVGGQAVYDSTLKAPKCATVGTQCDSGASLLLGRSTKGPEPNYPNTINASCADGTSGTYHSDESNDALKVETTDGTSLAAGKTAKITATVYAYSTSADYLDLYCAADANSPSWTLIGTYTPTVTGVTTITANYTLPTGALQAVRANFRYNGSAGSCTTGSYDDHDDLVFAVGGGSSDTTPPTTSITAPAAGATVSGTSSVTASASDNVGVSKVEFYLDGVLKSTDTTSPYAWSWDTTTATNGSHSLQSKAHDAAGNAGSSSTVSVTVSNASSELLTNGTFTGSSTGWTRASYFYWSSGAGHDAAGYAYSGTSNSKDTTMYQQVAIPSSATGTLTFWTSITTNETTTTTAYDTLKVEVRNTSGTVLATLATYSNLDKGTSWVQRTLNMSAYKGQTVRLYFHVKTDSSKTTTFKIDDVSLK